MRQIPKRLQRANKVKQVLYHDWSSKLKPEHEGYWEDIGDIAQFIAFALEGYKTCYMFNPAVNDEEEKEGEQGITYAFKSTTISVGDYKEKYGCVRVYCGLATLGLVRKKYDDLGTNKRKNGMEEMSFEKYHEHCMIMDARRYRHVYFSAISLWPHYRDAIISDADMPELLFISKEEYEQQCNGDDDDDGKTSFNAGYFSKYKDFVYKVCGFE